LSTTVDQHWNRHYRELKETSTMPLTVGLPAEAATIDPFDPEALHVEMPATRWAKAARKIISEEQVAEEEEPVAEEEPTFVRLSAHGVACEVAIVLVTPEIAQRYLKNQSRNRGLRRRQVEFLARQMRDSRGTR
jgi:hypothetical protein